MRFYKSGLPLLAALVITACSSPSVNRNAPPAGIEVVRGPTTIQGGNALGAEDITVRTPHFAFAIALGGEPGAKGGVVDMALVENGGFGPDRIVSLDFVPGEGELRLTGLNIVEQTAERLVIELEREWNGNTLLSRYEVGKDYPGIKLSTRLQSPARETLFAGYRLLRNEPGQYGKPSYNEVPRMVQTHWTAAQPQAHLGELYETDDLRRPRQPGQAGEFGAWLSAGSLGDLHSDKEMYTTVSDQAAIGLFELAPAASNFESYLSVMRQRWDRGERVYLSASPQLKDARQQSAKLYAYTPKGRIAADFATAAAKGHSFVSFGPEVYPITTNFGGEAAPYSETEVEFRSELGLAKAEVWLDGKQVAGWSINGAKWFRTGVPVPPKRTWMQWVVEDRQGNRAYSNPIWIK
ncbi:hypothetical protein C7H85_07815 [Zobellella endophytica]|uniref:Uncharacterized protein n=1 Tax=Zobellella endophytica TaxID=2116700 RepID=A0A2P7R8H1_9GAMM|nr:hypothetical protein [Zobellella endophytica]PSJ46527.1 hypothetical protein C7H85_07815 [Zobellella endophytica]